VPVDAPRPGRDRLRESPRTDAGADHGDDPRSRRETPTIRACAWQHWQAATAALSLTPSDRRAVAAEAATFWDWALVELLVQSGLRIEEASEVTTLVFSNANCRLAPVLPAAHQTLEI
jgi:hypothetical protein